MAAKKKETPKTEHQLPAGIKAAYCEYPKNYKDRVWVGEIGSGRYADFELWMVTGMGWVIPTLDIGGARNGYERRTYAVTLDGQIVRVGRGPHVTATVQVYVTKQNADELKKYTEIRDKGEVEAHKIRDRISTRRAQGAFRW